LKNLQGPDVLKLLIAVDELNIQSLISHIQEFLIEHQTEFLHQNPTEILETIYQHESFMDLWNFCLENICEEPKILFDSDKFINLKAPLLELLLKRDDLYMDEIEIWESLLKWCFVQQNVKNDPANWSKDDITKIERSLHRFIPLIRFYNIEPTDFFYKVYNYRNILPQVLIYDLLEFHIVPNIKPKANVTPPRKPTLKFKLDSTLIKPEHITIFSSWIDKKVSSHCNKKNIPYKFNLLYRASRDGNSVASFHEKCDNKGATVVVAKIQNSEKIVGGYNPLFWDSSDLYKSTNGSFIFSFTDRNNLQSAKVGYCNENQNAVYCNPSNGPVFGNGSFHCYGDGTWIGYPNTYPKVDDIQNRNEFNVDDYEVFQVVKM